MTTFTKLLPMLLPLTQLLAACSEREESGLTRVRGQVMLADSNTPVPNPPPVQVWAQATGGMVLGAYVPVFDPQPTDASGRFDFSFPADKGHDYILRSAGPWPGYYTIWDLAPRLRKGEENLVRVPVYAPAWVKVNLVDEPPRSRVWIKLVGDSPAVNLTFPRDTTIVFPFLTGGGRESFVFCSVIDTTGKRTEYRHTFIQPPLDTQRIRIAF